jgi:hypothetical protein
MDDCTYNKRIEVTRQPICSVSYHVFFYWYKALFMIMFAVGYT